ncbi:IgGFc-binding protein-like [Ostrea edulis]|uniref:IgGFc-binding protein-like n=1 Tax=Ostrea edulis TaxID=37623 RepID=UPI0024AF8C50|nr:IgGFc-binding protein-like [Ostrea edulis]
MRNHPYASGSLTIYVTTDNETTVNISSSPHLKPSIKSAVDSSVSITSNSKFTLPFELTCEYVKVEPKAVIVRTSELSTVTIFDSFYINTNDGTLVIPTHKLSNQYLISTTEPYSTSIDYSQFAIGALIDRTDITIKFKMANTSRITLLGGTYSDGDVFSITLDRFETFQANHNTDLSGTFITSTEPIAVFSGNRCNKLKNSGGCNHMLTQLPPTTELDHQFIVPPFFHNSETLIQVVTQTHNAVNITIEGSESSWILNEREFRNLKSNQIAVLVSSQPVSITGFGMGLPYDTYMTVIPGVHQYLAFYKITIPSGYTENFLCLIIPAVSIDNLQINGLSRDHYNTVYQSSVYLDKAYDVRVFQVKNTGETFVLSTTDKSEFGLIVYGHRAFDGYGFSGNFVLP